MKFTKGLISDNMATSTSEYLGLRPVLLQDYGHRILKIMDVFTNYENYPILMYCSSGKDESSLIAALLMGVLGVDDKDIEDDYHLNNIRIAHDSNLYKYLIHLGWTDSSFEAPKEAMTSILKWINNIYGSIPLYLESIGFSIQKQVLIKHCMLISDTEI